MAYDFDKINRSIDTLQLLRLEYKDKAADTNRGEWKTSCPYCGGDDRCSIWPYHKNGPRGWCRVCQKSFDGIDLYCQVNELDRKTALDYLSKNHASYCRSSENQVLDIERDYTKWDAAAAEFVEDCKDHLFNPNERKALDWLLKKRGLSLQSIITANLGFNPEDKRISGIPWGMDHDISIPKGVVIPNPGHGLNIRKATGKNKYHKIAGSRGFVYCAGGVENLEGHHIGFLFESEFDAILAHSTGYHAAFFSLPAGQTLNKPEYNELFKDIDYLIIAMDQDQAGEAAAEKHLKIKNTIKAEPLPKGKDLTEYYQLTGGYIDDVTAWLLDQTDNITEDIPEGELWI